MLLYRNEALVALHICSLFPAQKGSQIEIFVDRFQLKTPRIKV